MASKKVSVGALKVQSIAFFSSLVTVFIVGVFQNLFRGGDCYSFFDIGSCNANSPVSYLFKLYIVVMFSISLAHFGFVKWGRIYYFLLITPLALFGLSDAQFAPVALFSVGLGVIFGIILSKVRSKYSKN